MNLKGKTRESKGYIVDEIHRFNILLDTREVYLHGHIDSEEGDSGVEYRMSNNFVKNMRLLERLDNKKPIFVHQHSIGGEWAEGMMQYDAISTSQCPVVLITHGIAASMGSIIPQAADLRISMPNCWWLIHDGYTDIDSSLTMKQSKSWAGWEEITGKQMREIYVSSCKKAPIFEGKTPRSVLNYIEKRLSEREDWWLSSGEAVEHGFCDAVYGAEGYKTMEDLKTHVC